MVEILRNNIFHLQNKKIALKLCYGIILYNSSTFIFNACAILTAIDKDGSFSFFSI